jgi:hypothetical protein
VSRVDWSSGTAHACQPNGTHCQTINLAQGEAYRVGAASMTPGRFLDFAVLPEIGHSFGADHRGTNAANGTAGYNKTIWETPFK